MEKRIYKLMDAKGRVLIPKELRVETGIGYGDIVALEIADGKQRTREKLSAEAHLNKFTGGGHADMRP